MALALRFRAVNNLHTLPDLIYTHRHTKPHALSELFGAKTVMNELDADDKISIN